MSQFTLLKSSFAVGVGLCLTLPAFAQTASDAGAAKAKNTELTDLEEIIVTARRKEESAQDVPISMTVFSQAQLSDRNVVNAGDLAAYTPSLASNSRFGLESTSFAIRGFIQEGPTSPSAAVYFADVVGLRANGGTTAGNGAGPGSYFDLQNVQVLKGPQGTLFGRNTTGGAILLVPQKPTGEFGGYVEGSMGNYDLRRIQAVLNAPVSDRIRLRFGVDKNSRDGYVNNVSYVPGAPLVGPKDFFDVNYTALRASAVIDVTPNIENYTVASYSKSSTHGFLPKMVFAFPTGYRAANYQAQVAALSGNFYDASNGNPYAHQDIKQWQAINTTTWTATDTLTVKNIISYGEFRQRQASSIYGDNGITLGTPNHLNIAINTTPGPGRYNASQSTFTEELQLQGHPFDSLTYQVGGYYERALPLNGFQTTYSANFLDCIDVLTLQCTDTRGQLTPSGAAPPAPANLEGRVGSMTISQSKYYFKNRGIFAQSTFNFTDQWALTAGARYTSDDTSGTGEPLKIFFPSANTPSYTCANPVPLVQGGTPAQVQADPSRCLIYRSVKSSKPTWMVDVDYKPIDEILIYAKYSRGYRQGSVNVSSYGLETWQPEKVDTYEMGTKTKFQSFVSGIFNVSVFYNAFSDQQLQLGTVACTGTDLITNPTQCPFAPSPAAGIANAGKSLIKGVETETSINLIKGLNLEANYTYLDTKIQTITLPPIPLGFKSLTTAPAGGPIPLTPTNKYAATLSYTLPLADSIGRITLSAGTTFQSSTNGSVSSISSGLFKLPAQRLYNANINWNSILGQPLDLSLFATNLTREKFYLFTTGASFGFDSAIVNEPRMFGARVKYRFGG